LELLTEVGLAGYRIGDAMFLRNMPTS